MGGAGSAADGAHIAPPTTIDCMVAWLPSSLTSDCVVGDAMLLAGDRGNCRKRDDRSGKEIRLGSTS